MNARPPISISTAPWFRPEFCVFMWSSCFSGDFAVCALAHGDTVRCAARRPPDRAVLYRRKGHAWCKLQFETHEVPEAHLGAARQLEAIDEKERTLVSNDMSGQEKVDLAVRSRCRRHDFEPTSSVRDASNLPAFTEQDSPVVVGPEYLHDLARAGGVNRYQCPKAIHSHCVPPVVCPGNVWAR